VVPRLRAEAPSLVALFSLFPETFSFTAHEALTAGIPLFTTPVGIFPRLLKETEAGRVATSFDPRTIAEELIAYLSSDDLTRHANNAFALPLTPRRRMAEQYFELYREVLKN
jgi:glycosyltransferase involved in cell wall biosynthesis